MQIVHLISRLDDTDSAQQLLLLAKQQIAAGDQVLLVALAADRAGRRQLTELGTASRVLDARWKYDPIVALRLLRLLRSTEIGLIHIWDDLALSYADWTLPRASTAPLIATLSTTPTGPWVLDDLVDRVVLSTATQRESALAGEVPADKVLVIRPGVTPNPEARFSRDQLLSALGLPEEAWIVAVACPLVRKRQLEEVIWCFELVRTLHEQVRLVVIGEGPDRHRLERFTRLVSSPDAVRFLGSRPDADQLLTLADAFWHLTPSETICEPISMGLLQAQAARLPVVASRSPATGEVIQDGVTGLLVPAGDRAAVFSQTERLLKDRPLATTLAQEAAAESTNRFSDSGMYRAYGDLYGHLLDGNL